MVEVDISPTPSPRDGAAGTGASSSAGAAGPAAAHSRPDLEAVKQEFLSYFTSEGMPIELARRVSRLFATEGWRVSEISEVQGFLDECQRIRICFKEEATPNAQRTYQGPLQPWSCAGFHATTVEGCRGITKSRRLFGDENNICYFKCSRQPKTVRDLCTVASTMIGFGHNESGCVWEVKYSAPHATLKSGGTSEEEKTLKQGEYPCVHMNSSSANRWCALASYLKLTGVWLQVTALEDLNTDKPYYKI